MSMICGGGIDAHGQFVGGSRRIGDPLRDIHVHGFLVDCGRCGNAVIVSGRRVDGGVRVDVHCQGRGVGQAGLVLDRIRHVIGACLFRRGEREHAVDDGDAVDALRFDVFGDREVRVVAADVVLGYWYGRRRIRAQGDFVIARVHAGIGAGGEDAHTDLRGRPLSGPILHSVGEGVGA